MTTNHLMKYFDQGIHLDGRKLEEFRDVKVELGVTKSAEGSARVKIGDTEVLAGVKIEVQKPYPDTPAEGNLMVNVELLPLSSPKFESGPPGIEATEIARVVDRGIRESDMINRKKLCIREGELVWSIMIDICSINDGGNLMDASCLAATAALKNTNFPGLEGDVVNYDVKTKNSLPLEHECVSVTVRKIGKHLLIDPYFEEEDLVESRLSVASLKDGTICAFQKGGTNPISFDDLKKMIDLALKKSKELRKKLEGK